MRAWLGKGLFSKSGCSKFGPQKWFDGKLLLAMFALIVGVAPAWIAGAQEAMDGEGFSRLCGLVPGPL